MGGQVRGLGASWGFLKWSSAVALTPHPAPPPSRRTHFPGLLPSPKFVLGSAPAEALPQHPVHTHTRAHAHAHTHFSPPPLFRPSAAQETARYLGK